MRWLAGSIFVVLGLFTGPVFAGPASDYIQQMSYTSPGSFHGQQRDFLTGGSISVRWKPSTTEFPVSLTPPSLKAGCGGIDASLGGISFLTDPKYLQNTANNIIMGATYVEFMMAVEEGCPTCMNALRTAQYISSQLNQLQLDSCRASKALVTVANDMGSGRSSLAAERDSAWGQISGAGSKFWQGAKDSWDANGGAPQSGDDTKVAACPSATIRDFKDIFIPPAGTTSPIYALDQIAVKKNIPADYMAQIRGVVGDIKITPEVFLGGNVVYVFEYVHPCEQNAYDTLGVFTTGDNWERPSGFQASGLSMACAKVTDPNANLVNWAYNQMTGVAAAINRKTTPLTPAQKGFVGMNGYPIHELLKLAVTNGEVDTLTAQLAEPVARGYAYQMITEVGNSVKQGIYTAKAAITNPMVVGSVPSYPCEIGHLSSEAADHIKALEEKLDSVIVKVTAQFNKSFVQVNHAMDYEKKVAVYNETAMKNLTSLFGQTMARRAMKSGF